MPFLKQKEICYILLGHEINQQNFELTFTSKERCRLIAEDIKKLPNRNYLILFMGLGRLQGACEMSISECMFEYFKNNYFMPKAFNIDKNSVDTVGDIIFAFEFLKKNNFKNQIKLATSDWHYERCNLIKKKIYGSQENFSFLLTSELEMLSQEEKINIFKKEKNSIDNFKKSFKDFNHTKSKPYLYLKDNHDYYKNINP